MGTVADLLIRPMTVEDAHAVERLTDEAYHDVGVRTLRAGWPTPTRRTPEHAARWQRRLEHLLRTDPGGCWVAVSGSGPDVVGASVSMRRDLTWILSSLAVRPGTQGRGVGRQLLDAALSHGRGCLRGMLASSPDPAAVRRYRLAGFTLHPAMVLRGRVARSVLPVVERVREGSAGDRDLLDSVDRRVRDSAHGVDHEVLLQDHRLVVADRSTGSGYAYVPPGGGASLLAATNRRTATDLLWESLAASSPDVPVDVEHVTAVNEWAVDVGMASRLELWTEGYLALRGMKPPAPYLHNGGVL
jgi:GNAT superfamily N-acetyltransferase